MAFVALGIGVIITTYQLVAVAKPTVPRAHTSLHPHSEAKLPENVVCQPLFVCDIVLDPGEMILSMATGDSVRWILSTAVSGHAANQPHVLVKPTDYGLRTDLIITTDRRVCYIVLVSTKHDYQYQTRFFYPVAQVAHIESNIGADSTGLQVDADNVDVAYRVRGDRTIMPKQVMNDGTHTYIKMPEGLQDLPTVFVIGNDGSDTITNYRFRGSSFILDGVPQRIALVEGSGRSQRRVIIERGN
jgi:type IV secretion system protein VirB9